MARSHGIVKTEIWDIGSDFRQLSLPAQWGYVMLLSQPQITNCGVQPYKPSRWVKLSAGLDAGQLDAALTELRQYLYVVIDLETDEILVRTFIKHDRIWKQPNLVISAQRELRAIDSDLIRQVLAQQYPWLADGTDPKAVKELEEHASSQPLTEDLRELLSEGLGEPLRDRARVRALPSPTPPRDGASVVHAADAANGLTAASPPGLHKTKKPWSLDAAEALIRNVGWMDPHPKQLLEDTYDHVPTLDKRKLVSLAHTLAAAETGAPVEAVEGDPTYEKKGAE